MMAFIFLLLAISTGLAWGRQRRIAMIFYIVTLIIAVFWFGHHITSHLDVDL